MRGPDTLHAAVTGTADRVPPIVAAVWQAINLRLGLAPAGAWTDLEDLAADTGFFLDCSPALAAELLEAAISTGALEGHLDPRRTSASTTTRPPRPRSGTTPRRKKMNMTEQYVKPPSVIAPQLSRSDLARLTPEQIVQADDSGQTEVIKSGRDPLDFERRGERWATPTEIAEALQAAAADANQQRQANRAAARNEGLEV